MSDAAAPEALVSDLPPSDIAITIDVGFGDLPGTPVIAEEPTVNDTDVFSMLADFDGNTHVVFSESEPSILTERLAESDFLQFPEIVDPPSALQEPSISEIAEDIDEHHGTFSMPAMTEGEEYFVTEVVTDEERVDEAEIDVMTDHDNVPAAQLDFTVEERVTEVRRTEVGLFPVSK